MKTEVRFRSDKFPPYDEEEQQGNPGLWGRRLAEYLVEKMAGAGVATEEPIPEDWGWYIPIRNERFRLAVCCGHRNGDDDQFLCFTDPSTPIIRKLFKKIDVSRELGHIVTESEKILSSDPDIRDIEWTEE